ncbi:MAG: SDR family NAD(P)-dependent oxidoreductase [Streptosporangiaceae bacterium]
MAGRAVLVTGASRGIGRVVARAFAAAGDRVAVHFGSSRDAAEATYSALPGEGHIVVEADFADPEAVRRAVDEAAEKLGGLDILVNNAGVYLEQPVDEGSYEEWLEHWRETIDVNLIGAANAIWCAARHMLPAGGGRIVNVSSRGAYRGEPRHPAYGASKAGLNALGQSMAQALGPHGIGVLTLAPGYVETEMVNGTLRERGEEILQQSPFGRIARPEEVAHAVLFLASPEAEFASGAVLDLNGASYLR